MTGLHEPLLQYLTAHAWEPPLTMGDYGGLWRHPESQLSVAVPFDVAEGSLDWQLIIERLAFVEGRSAEDVDFAIRVQTADVANLRAANGYAIRDTIPYPAGVALVQGGWSMLRTTATSSMRMRSRIGRSYSPRADRIARSARMAQSKRGSYIIPLLLPLSQVPPIAPGLVNAAPPEPVERRVMRTFAEALASISTNVVEADRAPRASELVKLVHAGVSAEFASALHRLLGQEAVDEFSVTFEWARSGGPAPDSPRTVTIPAAAASLVAETARILRNAPQEPGVETLTGPIRVIARDDPGGVVTIDTLRHSRAAHVSVRVSSDALLDQALDWMKRRTTVVIDGRIERRGSDLFSGSLDSIEPLTARQLL